MSETSGDYQLEVGGKTWTLAPLPFRAVKIVQPALFKVFNAMGGETINARTAMMLLNEADLDLLGKAVWMATQYASEGPKLTRDEFDDLPISVSQLTDAVAPVALAVGMVKAAKPNGAGQSDANPSSIGTG